MHVAADAEALRLRGALRDLVALSAIPAAWIGSEPPAVAAGLADALLELLQLDFAFVRLVDPGRSGAVEVTRGAGPSSFPEWLDAQLAASAAFARKAIVLEADDELAPRRTIAVPIGVNGEGGVVAAACDRVDFPTSTDRLLLSLGANHAAAAFQNARLIHERKRAEDDLREVRNELEVRVAERTAELHVANDELDALRRVATLVAQGVSPSEIFSAVSDEVGGLFGSDQAAVGRFERDGSAMVVVGVSTGIRGVSIGTRWPLEDFLASTAVYRTGRAARNEQSGWEDAAGPVAEALREIGFVSTVAAPIVVEGNLWGVMTVSDVRERLPPDAEERIGRFTELVATAIANAHGRAELAASRRRIVAASDEARSKIERDLHDGAQQRLVSLALGLSATADRVPSDRGDLRAELSELADGLAAVLDDLQEISRGIHPAILSHGGVGPALQALAGRSAIPVEVDVMTEARAPEPIELAVYYVASEALANAAKHAQATRIEVSLAQRDRIVLLSIRDDGIGGADPGRGSGLVGLADRVEALGGSIRFESLPGRGTQVTAELPLEPEAPQSD